MTLWTSDPVKAKYAREYFASLNPMATRIIESQENVINSYSKEKWKKMSVAEQEKVLNQSMITPETTARYRSTSSAKLPKYYKSVFPKLIVETGQAYATCIDDSKENEPWKDEHSEPFSWETRSQMNMSMPSATNKPIGKKKKDSKEADPLPDDMKSKHFGKNSLTSPIPQQINRIENKPNQFLKSSDIRKISTGSNNSADVCVEDVKVVLKQPSFSSHHAKKEPLESSNDTGRLHNLQSKDIRRPVTHQRQKSSGRINPRSSLTLDDNEQLVLEDDEPGAIRNLEVAMREEQKALKARKASSSRSSSENIPMSTESSTKAAINESVPKPEYREESPLLDFATASIDSEKEDDDESAMKKSGFDFLDNW